jgi:DNA modification methylase
MALTPYYEQGGITIYHGDCLEVLPELPRRSCDLLLTDPPYGVKWQGKNRPNGAMFDVLVGDDGSLDVAAAIALALPIIGKNRHLYVFGRHDFSALPITSSVELIWDKAKLTLGDLTLPWALTHEVIMFSTYVPSKASREQGHGRLAARLRRGSVIRVQRLDSGQVSRHPTEKPVELLRQLIEASSLFGETVLDPFMGVGSTLVAALLEGRHAIGIEIEERYCHLAAERLRQQAMQFEGVA